MTTPAIDPVAYAAHNEARAWVLEVLDAAARAEGFDSYQDSDWSPDVDGIVERLAKRFMAQAKSGQSSEQELR